MKKIKSKSSAVSFQITSIQLRVIKEFARRQGIPYKDLIQNWLKDDIRKVAE